MSPAWETVLAALVAAAMVITIFLARVFALKVQDRVIRLEMRLRLRELLPADLAPRIAELTPGQLVALRFAGDRELPALVRRVLDERLQERKAIKQMIADWQADDAARVTCYQISPTVNPSGNGSCGIDDVLREAGDPGGARELRDDGGVGADRGFLEQRPGEHRAEHAFVAERLADLQPAARVERRHLRARAGAARRAIDRAGPRRRAVPVQLSRSRR